MRKTSDSDLLIFLEVSATAKRVGRAQRMAPEHAVALEHNWEWYLVRGAPATQLDGYLADDGMVFLRHRIYLN